VVSLMVCCAFCGEIRLHGDVNTGLYSPFTTVPATGESPPYAAAAAHLGRFMETTAGLWNACCCCAEDRRERERRVSKNLWMPTSVLASITRSYPSQCMALSLADSSVSIANRFQGYARGMFVRRHPLDHPMLRMSPGNAVRYVVISS
jgi:hypothetical protein